MGELKIQIGSLYALIINSLQNFINKEYVYRNRIKLYTTRKGNNAQLRTSIDN